MKLTKLIALYTLIIFFSSCQQNNEEVLLRINREVGSEQTIISLTETSSGSFMRIKNIIEVTFKVTSLNENIYTLTSDVIKIESETKMGEDIEKYDSEKEVHLMSNDEKSMHIEFKSILDSTFNISLDNQGNVSKSFSYLNGNILEFPIVDMSNIQLIFPEKKVKVGSEWENNKTNSLTSQETKSVYTIEDITDKEIIISVNSKISGISGVINKNNIKGEYILDKKTCNLIKGTLEMNLQTGGKATYTYYEKK